MKPNHVADRIKSMSLWEKRYYLENNGGIIKDIHYYSSQIKQSQLMQTFPIYILSYICVYVVGQIVQCNNRKECDNSLNLLCNTHYKRINYTKIYCVFNLQCKLLYKKLYKQNNFSSTPPVWSDDEWDDNANYISAHINDNDEFCPLARYAIRIAKKNHRLQIKNDETIHKIHEFMKKRKITQEKIEQQIEEERQQYNYMLFFNFK